MLATNASTNQFGYFNGWFHLPESVRIPKKSQNEIYSTTHFYDIMNVTYNYTSNYTNCIEWSPFCSMTLSYWTTSGFLIEKFY